MKTIPVYNKECDDLEFISVKQVNYTYALHKLYKKIDKFDDKKLEDFLRKKYKLTDIEYRSLKSDVKSRFEKTSTEKTEKEERIMWNIKEIEELQAKEKTKNITRSKFKKHNKIKQLEDCLPRNITFGGKETLRELTRLHNNIRVIENDKEKTNEQILNLLFENELKIEEKTKEWKENRILHFYLIGEANQHGNRFVDFDFKNHTIIYKPYKGKKITFKYSCSKKNQKELLKLKELIDNKEISITLQISTKQICISFDNEVMSGYYINKPERKKEVKAIDKNLSEESKKEIINLIYKKYRDDLKKQKLVGKVENRYVSIDKNPYYIGYCIADKGSDGIDKIIEKGVIDFSLLHEKLGLPSDHPLAKKQKNKGKFEIQNSWKSFFNVVNHYRCAYFVTEDVDGINGGDASFSKEANRKTRNIWHRTITDWQIEKRCIEAGIEMIPINPCYTTFIGNINYNYFDATNAAIEICRRGMFYGTKGLFYPSFTGAISDTTIRFSERLAEKKSGDAQIFKDCENWVSIHKVATNNGLRWRWGWDEIKKPYSIFSMNNMKSKVKIVRFT